MTEKLVLTIRVMLTERNYRDIEIPADTSLYKLAEAINFAYGFSFDHPFGFYSNIEDIYESETVFELFADMGEPVVEHAKGVKKTKLSKAFPNDGAAYVFLFDYGDEWMFKVERLSAKSAPATGVLTKVVASKGKSPKQYG